MKTFAVLFAVFQALSLTEAATSCKKDACFNAVASQSNTNPSLAIRQADCKAVLKTIIDDDAVTTVTRFTTVTATTVTVTEEIFPTAPSRIRRRAIVVLPPSPPEITAAPKFSDGGEAVLLPRDQIIVGGSKPSYASACANLQSYAIACICFGVKASTYKVVTRTSSTTKTVSQTATATVQFNYIEYLRSEGGEFCTSFNSYEAPITTENVIGTTNSPETLTEDTVTTIVNTPAATTVTATSTVTETETATLAARDAIATPAPIETYKVIFPEKNTESDTTATITQHITHESLARRAPIETPASITGLPSSRISSACSSVATGTITNTITTEVTTIYAATETNTATVNSEAPTPTDTVTETVTVTEGPGPTSIVGGLPSSPDYVDDSFFGLTTSFPIGAFGTYSTNVYVSSNGFISINQGSASLNYGDPLPSYSLPDVTIAALWEDLIIYNGYPHVMNYQTYNAAPNRIIIFNFNEARYSSGASLFKYSVTFYENRPGYILVKYFSIAPAAGLAFNPSAGVQKKSTEQSLVYKRFGQRVILGNTYVAYDTEAGTMTSGHL